MRSCCALGEAQSRHSQISFDLNRAKGHLQAAKTLQAARRPGQVSVSAVNEAVESDPFLKQELERTKTLEEYLTEMRTSMRYYQEESKYIQTQKRLKLVKAKIETRRKDLKKELTARAHQRSRADNDSRMEMLQAEIAALEPQEAAYRARADKLEKEARNVSEKTAQYEGLKAEIASSSAIVEEVGRKFRYAKFELDARAHHHRQGRRPHGP